MRIGITLGCTPPRRRRLPRAEQEQGRRWGDALEDPIDRMCEHFPNDVAQAQRLQKKLAEHVRHLLRPQQDGLAQVAHAAEADE